MKVLVSCPEVITSVLFVCLSVCLFVSPSVARISQTILVRFSSKLVEGLTIDQGPTIKFWSNLVENWMRNVKSVSKLLRVAGINKIYFHDCAHYYSYIIIIYKQVELTKNNGLGSSIVYRIEWS